MVKKSEEKIDLTIEWIREQVVNSGSKGVLVGLSGGIDSSLVAYLIKKAFPDHALGVILPCKSNPKDAQDAILLAEACGIEYLTVDLSDEHEMLYGKIQRRLEGFPVINERLADANLRARLRMSTLYGIGNSLGYLVAGTDNAAELLTGYFTKYGDGGVDIIPLGNLLKRDVFEWSALLGVPQAILDRKPSAGLWDGQTDEGEMGTTYDMIDDYILGLEIPEADQVLIERMQKNTAHKRKMPPTPPKF